jgi:hypothetical protein
MANQATLRRIALLRAEVEALKARREVVRYPTPSTEGIRETLRVLIDVGELECDGTTIWRKGTAGDEGRGDDLRRERERGLA